MKEETLDPDDWDELRRLGHQMLDDMLDWQQTLGKTILEGSDRSALR
jgi:hypothetical protein